MIDAYTADDVRAAEQPLLAPDVHRPTSALMLRAAAGVAAAATRELVALRGRVYGSRVLVLAGSGNNGGDALHAGARLARRGARVEVVLTSGRGHQDALRAFHAAGGRVVDQPSRRPDLLLDGVLGIGARPGLGDAVVDLLERSRERSRVLSVDVPSGLDADSGEVRGPHVRADLTVATGAMKPALLLPPADVASGRVVVVDIGLDLGGVRPAVQRFTSADVTALWPRPQREDDKYRRGVVGIVAGGTDYTGAAVLAVTGAVRAGAGMVRYVGPAHPSELVRQTRPEAVLGPGRVQAWVLGPGVSPDDEEQGAQVRDALASGEPCVVDAGALDHVPRRVEQPALLVPHAGELARLLSARGPRVTREDVVARPLHHVRAAVALTGATVLLKGATTIVASPDGRVRSQRDGTWWLATAGAGDVLAGVAGTLLAAGVDPVDAGALAALVHGRAGTAAAGGGPLAAMDVASAIPGVLASLLADRL